MEDPKTTEVKLTEAEAELAKQKKQIDELTEKLSKVNNTDHFEKLKKERDEAKSKLKEIEDAKAMEKGEIQKLYDQKVKELAEAKERDELKPLKESLGVWLETEVKELIDSLPNDEIKELAPEVKEPKDLLKLKKYVKLHTAPTAVNTDAGIKAKGGKEIELTEQDKKEAERLFGHVYDPEKEKDKIFEAYAQLKVKREANKKKE